MKYSTILFDMDGVLIDSEPAHYSAFELCLCRYGSELTREEYALYFAGKTDLQGFRDYKSAHPSLTPSANTLCETKASLYQEALGSTITPYADVVGSLPRLAEMMTLGLVTSSSRHETHAVIDALDIRQYFTVVITADDVTRGKPNPEPYVRAAKKLAVRPEQCVVIEDSPSGVSAASAARMHCIALTHTHTESQLREADRVVTAFDPSLLL